MRLALLATIALTLSAITPNANAANWPNWRGPTQNGVSTETGIPALRQARSPWTCVMHVDPSSNPPPSCNMNLKRSF